MLILMSVCGTSGALDDDDDDGRTGEEGSTFSVPGNSCMATISSSSDESDSEPGHGSPLAGGVGVVAHVAGETMLETPGRDAN